MSRVNFSRSIFSRPVYKNLEIQPGNKQLMVADAEGAEAILDLTATAENDFWQKVQIIYLPARSGNKYVQSLKDLNPMDFFLCSNTDEVRSILNDLLVKNLGALPIYSTGSEGLISIVVSLAIANGYPHEDVQKEHRGTLARTMQCVHCKGITENIITDHFQCSKCKLHLFVRDHFSRRIGAFQGVRVDAESPGEIPESKEITS